MVNDHRFDPYWLGERKGGAFAAASAPKLRTGRFKATDKLIAVLKDAPIMRSKKTTRWQQCATIDREVRIKMDSALNSPVDDWGKLLGDSAAVTAMLDHLLHHGHVLKCGPRSW
jgi:hypothetical protein